MSHQSKKNLSIAPASVGHVIRARARFAPPNVDMNFGYFHSMDIWQQTELDLRRQIKSLKKQERKSGQKESN